MTDDAKQKMENSRNTFKARAKGKLKKWYIDGNSVSSLDAIADQFREEAEILFSDDALDNHLQYVELLADAAEKAIEESSVNPDDPELLFNHDASKEDRKRDGDRFERAIDEIQDQ
jgi:hypothetical protein